MKTENYTYLKIMQSVVKTGLMAVLLLAVARPSQIHAQQLSSLSGAFIDIGAGSRSAALGNAFVGLADDPTALFTNPAGMASFSNPSAMAMTTNQFGLVTSHYFSAVYPLQNQENMSVGIGAISSGDDLMSETTFQAAYAMTVLKGLSVGAALKARFTTFGNNQLSASYYEGLFDQTEISTGLLNQVRGDGNGFGLDIGVMYQPNEKASFGVSLRDGVAPFSWSSEVQNPEAETKGDYNEGLPMGVHAGGSYRFNKNLMLTTEYQPALEGDQDAAIRAGIETTIIDIISLRAGTEQWANNEDDEKYMLGVGIRAPEIRGYQIQVDYAYMMDQLIHSHRIGIIMNFPNLR